MFGFKKKPQPHHAAERTNLPLSPQMTLMMAQELPIMDSVDRARVYEILREYQEANGPEITRQEDLPDEIKAIMDL